ncbi:MAG TPA: hypothetical protein VFH92_02495 [Phenylobacterium sp.]|nr:hypothetical protein [Phenylobacterium sp.]
MGNLSPSQRAGIVGVIDPQSASTAKSTGWIDATTFHSYLATLQVGALGASATVDAKLQQATDNTGTGVKDVTGKSITQLTKAGTDDNKQVEINLRQEELDFNNGFKFFRLTITPATAASLISAIVQGFDTRYGLASDNDATTVDEIVV